MLIPAEDIPAGHQQNQGGSGGGRVAPIHGRAAKRPQLWQTKGCQTWLQKLR